MAVVFVHGVPETSRVFDRLRSELASPDHEALALPGFGSPLPEGFEATMDSYADWLIGELERRDRPHLVGHDWGGLLAIRAVSLRPELVASWASDAAAAMDPRAEWHALAKVWQTPGEGEGFMDAQLSLDAAGRGDLLEAAGVPAEEAAAMGAALDRTMADAVLSLYRSATRINDEWGPYFVDVPAPGLVLVPSDDPFSSAENARRSADRAGARVRDLEGQGHWWMLSDPAGSAAVLEEFWSGL